MKKKIPPHFFDRRTITVARGLLGKFLVRKIGKKVIAGMITEVEAYVGPRDLASHASRLWRGLPRAARGVTPRTKAMFGKPGHWYIYLVYGMHYCLNVVTEKEGYPAAVLIRSVEGMRGPGRVCKFFQIDRHLNQKPATRASALWIEDRGIKINPRVIARGKRIGVDYAGKWKDKLWRFSLP